MILLIGLVSLILSISCSGVLIWCVLQIIQLRKDTFKIMEVLAAASPALERRVLERGTQVVLSDRWVEDEVWSSETIQ